MPEGDELAVLRPCPLSDRSGDRDGHDRALRLVPGAAARLLPDMRHARDGRARGGQADRRRAGAIRRSRRPVARVPLLRRLQGALGAHQRRPAAIPRVAAELTSPAAGKQ